MVRIIVFDPPDPNCPVCKGRGVVGGNCKNLDRCARLNHLHTFSFCVCRNERYEELEDE